MTKIIAIVLPVIVMLVIGKLCSRFQLISKTGAEEIKKIMVNILLPIAIFHGVATGSYSLSVLYIGLIVFALVFAELGIGYLLRPALKEPYRSYLPFLMTVYEGGMIAYPLYMNLCGADNLSNVAMVDVANGIFCFSILVGLLQTKESGEKPKPSKLVKNAFTSPCFVALILGILVGVTGVMDDFLATGAGSVYSAVESMMAAPVSPMILLVVGYDMNFEKRLLVPSIKTALFRVVMNGILIAPMYLIVNALFGGNKFMLSAILVYMVCPPSYSVPAFVRKEEGLEYIATTNSLYLIFTLIGYSVVTMFFG